ncbi:hypothetical protein B7P34_05900 [Streptosporangium nondiastaticum]|uniref:Uncharacterized protein n=1 Tax=Streptosporangium nondiastaticum TaxID=35764 RepID=A0A9X7JTF2_9ACTN|nr:hypothetical protein [Streptosporangium nondiastaticum]PSJ29598.1 hypothetical protein B7P34_05900 [Streptosporangium nondiastaticum]
MSQWAAFDNLILMEKVQERIKSLQQLLKTQQMILANKEEYFLAGKPGGQYGLTADQARLEFRMLQENMETTLQKIDQARETLSQGPDACRAYLEDLDARLDAKWRRLEKVGPARRAPPEPQVPEGPGPGGVGPDAPVPDVPVPELPRQGIVRPPGAVHVAHDAVTPVPQVAEVPGGPAAAPDLPPPAAPVAAGEEALAGGEAATGAGAEAVAGVGASRVGRVLIGIAVIAAVAVGAYWAYNHFTSPSASSPSSASFNINGDYNGTANGAKCEKPECYVTVTKVSDPSGPGIDDAGRITVNFTAANWTPATTGVASVINMKIGPMQAWIQQDGTVEETGYDLWTDITDTTPGSGNRTSHESYKLRGKFTGVTNGSPSYTLTMVLSGTTYDLRGVRTG